MIYYAYMSCEDNYSSQHSSAIALKDRLFEFLGINGEVLKDGKGRPYIKGECADISFAHSKNLALCAVCCKNDIEADGRNICKIDIAAEKIGIDAEFINPDADILKLKKISSRYLGADITSAEDFYIKWTQREAYGKLCGEGFFYKSSDERCKYKSFKLNASSDQYQVTLAAR